MEALTSPVNAPSRSQWTFCAAIAIGVFAAAFTAAATAVNGGAIATSTSRTSWISARRSLTYETVSATVLNILKLPAIKGFRIGIRIYKETENHGIRDSVLRFVRKRGNTREFGAAQEFQRRAAACRDVRHLPGNARGIDGRHRITAAD